MKESKIANGRIGIYVPDYPKANNRGYILKSRYIVEKRLGRTLDSDEHVHHKDGNKLNDTPNNLKVVSTKEHSKIHGKDRRKHNYDDIKVLRLKNLGYKKISKILGIPRNSVRSACKVMGLTGKRG